MPSDNTTRDNRFRVIGGRVVRWFLPIYHDGAVKHLNNPCDLFNYLQNLNVRLKRLEDKKETDNAKP